MKKSTYLSTKLKSQSFFCEKKYAVALFASILGMGMMQSSVLAVSFTVTQMTTDEGFIFDDPNSIAVTPTGLNNVTSFTIDDGTPEGNKIFTDDFFAIQTEGVSTTSPIQPISADGTKLYDDDDSYLSAGVNGLSLSTGVNKITRQNIETLIFPVLSINLDAIGDGEVDFFVTDIAQNQSPDTWRLLDINGDVVASLITEGNKSNDGGDYTDGTDWNLLGKQNLARWDNNGNQIDATWGSNRNVSALAFELSDFSLVNGASWEDVSSMSLTVGEETNKPRTDYAFISSNVNSISFVNQVQPVPEPTTVLGTFMALGVGNLFRKKRLNKAK